MKTINSYSINIWIILNKLFLNRLPDLLWNNLLAILQAIKHKNSFHFINHKDPVKMTDYISHLKFRKENNISLLALYADKSKVKSKLRGLIPEKCIIPSIFELDNPKDLKKHLTNKPLILKLNTGSGKNFILKKGLNELNVDRIIKYFHTQFSVNPSIFSRELHYSLIQPKIIAEPLIAENPQDYKIFFFQGEAKFIQMDTDRYLDHKRNFYDLDWNLLPITQIYKNDMRNISKPSKLKSMIEYGRSIVHKEQFEFARVDFYQVSNEVFFGEMTFFPGGGIEFYQSKKMDEYIFNLLRG